jgi:mRNA interferase MazF
VSNFRRGDIVLVDFDPAKPNEVAKKRPAIVVTNNTANQFGTTLVVVPLSGDSTRVYPFQVLLPAEETGLNDDSKAQVEQVRAVGLARMGKKLGKVPEPLMQQIGQKIKLHLALE